MSEISVKDVKVQIRVAREHMMDIRLRLGVHDVDGARAAADQVVKDAENIRELLYDKGARWIREGAS